MLTEKFESAARDILEKNMRINESEFMNKKVVVVYDTDSQISQLLSQGYISALQGNNNAIIIDFSKIEKEILKNQLLDLEEGSTVILIQSTNFRLDDFRIRLNLNNAGVGCLEHSHLGYIKDHELENYADAIEYNTPYYEGLSDCMKEIFESGDLLEMVTCDGSILKVEGGFEEMKRNTGDYIGKRRGGGFPIGENFTEAQDFSKVNGEFSIYAYPDATFQVQFVEPFKVVINESILTCNDPKCPQEFREVLDKIAAGEDGEVFVRELGFGMNTGISKERTLSDVAAFERVSGFHISLGKKHNIYRKKIHKSITQRYHIDIFPDVDTISIDGKVIFKDGKYSV